MSGFTPNRAAGAAFAAVANLSYAVGNVASANYPSFGGLLLWRGGITAALSSLRGLRVSTRALVLAVSHTAHMVFFVAAVRSGPAWLPPAILAAAPVLLWLWDGARSWRVGVAAVAMVCAAFGFFWAPGVSTPLLTLALATAATFLVAVRLHLAVRWVGSYEPNTALALAYCGQALFGLGWCVVAGGWTFAIASLAVLVAASLVGHRAMYASASRCSPTVAAAFSPLSAVATAVLVTLTGGPPPSTSQILWGILWLTSGAFVAARAANTLGSAVR